MQTAIALIKSRTNPADGIDLVSQLRDSLAYQLRSQDDFVALVAGALSHRTIRMLSARLDGIAAYKGLDMIENYNQDSDGMYQVLPEPTLT
jgi:hypothetical protein